MLIQPQEFILPSGKSLLIRSAQPAEGESLSRHRAVTSAETYFMARYPEECTFNPQRMESYLTDMEHHPRNFLVTAFDDGQIVGDLGIQEVKPHLKYLHRAYLGMSIQTAYCNSGLGTRMLEIAIEQAKQNGFEQMELGVYGDNHRAIHLYEKLGFQRCGVQPRAFKLKDGTYRDEILMVKIL